MQAEKSELVEGDDVNRLHFVFKLLDLLLDQVSGDLIVLDGGANDDLEDAVGNRLLLPLGLPHEAVHLDAEDLVGEGLEISVLTPWLDFPDDEGLGNRGSLLLLGLVSVSLCLHLSGSSGLSLRISIEQVIKLILSGSSSSLGLLFLATLAAFATFAALFATFASLLALNTE